MSPRKKEKEKPLADRLHTAEKAMRESAAKAHKRGDYNAKQRYLMRRNYIKRIAADVQAADSDGPFDRRVFISYSQRTGTAYLDTLSQALERAGFACTTGFDQAIGQHGLTLSIILRGVARASFLVALLTKEHALDRSAFGEKHASAPWVLIELGMALARDMTFIVLAEDGVHEDYYDKLLSGHKYYVFDKTNYGTIFDQAAQAMNAIHDERLNVFLTEDGEA